MKTPPSPLTRPSTESKRHTFAISREQRSQAYVDAPQEAARQAHESTPRQIVQILRKLSVPLSLDALQNWRFAPPVESITVSLVVRLRQVEDNEAEFLLASISAYPSPNPITSKIQYFGPEKQQNSFFPSSQLLKMDSLSPFPPSLTRGVPIPSSVALLLPKLK